MERKPCTGCNMSMFFTDRGVCPQCGTFHPHQFHVPPPSPMHRCFIEPLQELEVTKEEPIHVAEEPLERNMEKMVKKHIILVLDLNKGNKTRAARDLGCSLKTLYNKLSMYGIHEEDI